MESAGGPAAADDAQATVFEGPEKTLEIDWVPGVGKSARGLRNIQLETLHALLRLARCQILSHESNDFFDSYVLSESSLFIYPYKLLIKTCGTTTLLRILPELLRVTASLGMQLEWLGYMRKNFSFPGLQVFPHGHFGQEVHYLQNDCELRGEGHVLGPVTSDHWCAYVFDECERPMSESTDRTLNIMMYGLHADVAKKYWKSLLVGQADRDGEGEGEAVDEAAMASKMTEATGIRELLPGVKIQAHVFEPCGYSMNGLASEAYYTIHVTPELECSYASFETNLRTSSYESLVHNVLAVFKPARFTMTLLADEGALRQMQGHPIETMHYDVTFGIDEAGEKSGTARYSRTARSETTFAGDYCCFMGNWSATPVEVAKPAVSEAKEE